jgi:hypothetical protein
VFHFLAYRTSNMTAGADQTGGDYIIPFSHATGLGSRNFLKSDDVKLIGSTAGDSSSRRCGYTCRGRGHHHFYAQAIITVVEVLGKLTMGLIVRNDGGVKTKVYKTYDISKELSGTSTNGVTYDVQADLELIVGDFVSVSLNFDNSGQDTFVVNGDTSSYKTFFTGYRIGR